MTEHIQIKSIPPRIQYIADGILNTFEFKFAIFKAENMRVYCNNTLQESGSYTVSFTPKTSGGTVTFARTPEKGCVITLFRNLEIERTTDFQEGGALRASSLNHELDYQIACQQQIADSLNRSMVLPPYATDNNVDLTLPTPSAGKAIVWNSDGTNLENSAVKINELESTLKDYKESAQASATIATEKAVIASNKADIATNKADVATEKASEAISTLASKANKDMDNLSESGKKNIITLSMPSDIYVDLSFIVNTPGIYAYTAPANGFLSINFTTNITGSSFILRNSSNIEITSNIIQHYSSEGNRGSVFIPMSKGQTVYAQIAITNLHTLFNQRFYYAQGEI